MRILNRSHVLSFDGGYVDLGKNAAFDLEGALTFAAWVRPAAGNKLQATILSKNYTAYEPQVQNSRFVFERGPEYKSANKVALNRWVHLAVTFDVAAEKDNIKLFINGDLDKSYTVQKPLTKTGNALLIGKRPGWNDGLFKGQMAGLAIWRVARTPWEVKQSVNAPLDTSDEDLVAYWPMDETSGTALGDGSAGKHGGTLKGKVSWVALDAPISVNPPSGQLIRNTSVQRLAQLLQPPAQLKKRGATAAPPAVTASAEVAHEPLPPSGRNGAARTFLDRVKLHNQQRIQQKALEANAQVAQAKQAKAERLRDAHEEANKRINSARFDKLFFLYKTKIHTVDPSHVVMPFFVGTTQSVTKTVSAKQIWQATGVTLAKGDSAEVSYVSGRWTISPIDRSLTGVGTLRFKGFDSYALPGANAGALVGRVGGRVFLIGNKALVPSGLTGALELATNDDVTKQRGKGYADNSGAIKVSITVKKQPVSTEATDLAVDPARKRIFWAQTTSPFSLHVADLDGNNHKVLLEAPGLSITSVALDRVNQRVYYIAGAERLSRVGYDGGKPQDLRDISGPAKDGLWQVDIDNDNKQLYWTNDSSIWRAGLNGKTARMIVSPHDAPYPIDLAVDGEQKKLYWVDRELKVVRRANLDGSDPEDLYAVPHPLRGLAIDEVLPDQQAALKKEVYWSAWEERITPGTPGIAGHWKLNEGRGDRLADSAAPFAPARREAVSTESEDLPPALRRPAIALRFDGPSDFLSLPQDQTDSLLSGSFTVQLWVKIDSLPAGDRALLSVGSGTTTNKLLHLVIRAGKPYLGFYNNDTAGKTEIKVKQWVHLAFRYDKAKKEQAIFVDGVLDAAETGHAPLQVAAGTPGLLGRYGSAADFAGLMADLHMVDRALTDIEVGVSFTSATPGDVLRTIALGPTWIYDDLPPLVHRPMAALHFDGADDYVKLPSAKQLGLTSGSFTVECWFLMDEVTKDDLVILGTDTQETSKGLQLMIRDGKPYMGFFSDDLAGRTAIEAKRWYHIAWRFTAGTREQAIFLDGKQTVKRTAKQAFLGEDGVYLGRWGFSRLFKGSVAELRIWRTARSADEILNNMRNHRETYVIRAAVDGTGAPEHLFEVPSEGGLNLVSKLSTAHEQRLIAYRNRKAAQDKAAKDIAQAHADYDQQVSAKSAELAKTHKETAAQITAKKAAHAQDRIDNRARLGQGKAAATRKIDDAKRQSVRKRKNAEAQAETIKTNASNTASRIKSEARRKRDEAQRERDKH